VPDSNRIPVLALIGGVGSGKSSLARWLDARRRIVLVDGDAIGHQALERQAVRNKIRHHFGESVFDDKGRVDRPTLGRLVFGSTADCQQARRQLEEIVHPVIRDAIQQQIDAARTRPEVEAVLLDAAVLLEAGWHDMCDVIVFVEAPERQRFERVAANRGWSEQVLKLREGSQLPLNEKRRAADYVIDNSGNVEEAGFALERILDAVLDAKAIT
jgi:dephospho-CoA kinase